MQNFSKITVASLGIVFPALAQDPTTEYAAQLLSLTAACNSKLSQAYSHDDGKPANTYICGDRLNAIYWTADMDIDCDGIETSFCNTSTDPWFLVGTAFGSNVDANKVPYFVIPNNFNRTPHNIAGGQIAATIYNGKLTYVVLADTGPANIIGEASPAAARILGINPDPRIGGSGGPVTYIVFTGTAARAPITEAGHAEALMKGKQAAEEFIRSNGGLGIKFRGGKFSSGWHFVDRMLNVAGPHSIKVTDLAGRIVVTKSGKESSGYSLGGVKPGVYFIQAEIGNGSRTARIVLF